MSRTLQSERLRFRAFERGDAERLAVLVNDIGISRWIGTMPHPYTLKMAQDYLDHVIGSGENTFALERDGALVGAISIGTMLGFWLARDHWEQGLMTEAAAVMIDDHFTQGPETLVSGYLDGNDASARVHQKLGFVDNGSSIVFSQPLGRSVLRHDLILTRAQWEGRT